MARRMFRSPKAMLTLLFGLVLGAVWAAGELASAAPPPKTGGVSISQGPGILVSPNPLTSTGTIQAKFDGNGASDFVSRSDHRHDGQYLSVGGGTLGGDLGFANGGQLIAPRVENLSRSPANPAAGQLWFDTSTQLMMYFDGSGWRSLGGSSQSPLLGASTSSYVFQANGNATQTIPISVTFTLATQMDAIIEFGAQFLVESGNAFSRLRVAASVDNALPNFFSPDTLLHLEDIRGTGSYSLLEEGSRLVKVPLAPGSHTVTLVANINSQFSSTIQNFWLKVSK